MKYSGTEVDVHSPYPAVVQEICKLVEAKLGETFNHVMLNRYVSLALSLSSSQISPF